jgi:hypothetical protein
MADLHRVWRTVLEMLSDRGYIVVPALLALDLDAFLEVHGFDAETVDLAALRKKMTLHLAHGGEQRSRQIRVLFLDRAQLGLRYGEKIGVGLVPALISRLGQGDRTQGLFILGDDLELTAPARKTLEEMREDGAGIVQWFDEAELMVNCVRDAQKRGLRYTHIPPPHTMGEPVLRLLPRLYVVDPVARYFNAQPLDLICEVRASETCATTKVYRRCASVVHREDVKDFL